MGYKCHTGPIGNGLCITPTTLFTIYSLTNHCALQSTHTLYLVTPTTYYYYSSYLLLLLLLPLLLLHYYH